MQLFEFFEPLVLLVFNILINSQLVLNSSHLLSQIVFFLVLVNLTLDLGRDVLLDFHNLDFSYENLIELV